MELRLLFTTLLVSQWSRTADAERLYEMVLPWRERAPATQEGKEGRGRKQNQGPSASTRTASRNSQLKAMRGLLMGRCYRPLLGSWMTNRLQQPSQGPSRW